MIDKNSPSFQHKDIPALPTTTCTFAGSHSISLSLPSIIKRTSSTDTLAGTPKALPTRFVLSSEAPRIEWQSGTWPTMLNARITNVHVLPLTHWYTAATQSIIAQLLITETNWYNNSYHAPCPARQHNSPMTKETFISED